MKTKTHRVAVNKRAIAVLGTLLAVQGSLETFAATAWTTPASNGMSAAPPSGDALPQEVWAGSATSGCGAAMSALTDAGGRAKQAEAASGSAEAGTRPDWTLYYGLCDASAVVALDGDFFAVADDEDNLIRVYRRGHAGRATHSLDVSSFLRVSPKSPEVDIEGAARIGCRIYWISSHGRSAKGREAPNRQRLFATTGAVSNGTVQLQPVSQPYGGLLRDLLGEPRLASLNLAAATARAPKAPHAINIEGLAATPEGHLLIGFRNPKPNGHALLVPLLNPAEVIEGAAGLFGDPILLDLEGRGIRSITLWRGRYLIIAGSTTDGGISRLYIWDGSSPPRWLENIDFGAANPEAIDAYECSGTNRLYIVSDDGCETVAGVPCKKLPLPALKRFRAACLEF